jgi:hypothetical protein
MRILILFLLLLLGFAPAALTSDNALTGLQQFNTFLQAEYDLAKSGTSYLLIDLQEHQLQLKASGLVLETFSIDDSRCWGQPMDLSVASLTGKSSLVSPERYVQVVSVVEQDAAETAQPLKAFELHDMPTSYRLHLDNGTEIAVRATSSHWFSRLRNLLAVPAWYLSRPLISNWNFLRGSPYNELALSMSEQDARKLYWAFSEGTPCLIRLPAAVAAMAPPQLGTKQ